MNKVMLKVDQDFTR